MVEDLKRGRAPRPHWGPLPRRDMRDAFTMIERIRARLEDELPPPLVRLYLARLDELELEVAILDALGEPRRVRFLAARRFGTGAATVQGRPLRAVAEEVLATVGAAEDPPEVPAETLADAMRRAAEALGVEVEVRIDSRLTARAATSERTVWLQPRWFGAREARRLVAHEVLGHLHSAARGARERLAIFEVGTAGSFADQEGLAVALEEAVGALDAHRLRILAARVVATDRMHDGAPFGWTARHLVDQHGLEPEAALAVTERAYRGGGVARDAGYLAGWIRVRDAVERGQTSFEELGAGRLSLEALPEVRWARIHGWASPLGPSVDVGAVLRAAALPNPPVSLPSASAPIVLDR